MRVFINTDGAAGPPNPGPAGAGYVIVRRVESGWDTVVSAVPLKWCTHHEAEYEAAIRALDRAVKVGATSALLRSDSALLVNQTSGLSAVKAPQLKPLAKRLRRQIEQFGKGKVKFEWVPKKQNKAADLLSKVALEKSAQRKGWGFAPCRFLREDRRDASGAPRACCREGA